MNTNSKLTANDRAKEAAISDFDEFRQYIRANSIGDRALSIKGLAGLCGVHYSSITKGDGFVSTKLTQKLAGMGFEGCGLSKYGFNADASWAVVEYFAYESQAKAPGAKRLARLFGALGVAKAFEIAEEPRVEETSKNTARKLGSLWDMRFNEARNVMLYRFLTKKLPANSQAFLLEGIDPGAVKTLMDLPEMVLDYLVAVIDVKELHQERSYQAGALTSAAFQNIKPLPFDFDELAKRINVAEDYLGRFSCEKKGFDDLISRVGGERMSLPT
jgi:hypothetical protein